MDDIEITHIKFNQSSKGTQVFDKEKSEPYYTFQKGSSNTAVATLPYCPSCSATHEYDKRFGEVKPKWSMNSDDYEFRLEYKTDENGELYACCSVCGWDLRKENTFEIELEPVKTEETIKEIYLKGVYYSRGCYWMSKEDFKTNMIKHMQGVKMKLCFIHKNGDVKRMKPQAFSNAKYLEMENNKVGVKAICWE